ncbi:helix-turn-helix domain-containing protein [uncultured Jannaschia sp.]|uniref:MerR family transcriptional regulator n=1 Tax=uncultured Jannaschia sp. TaxID=293347 RepID=UPI0026096949|nr:helix-turn-helix domain-containing protein [uncultured Jannaschia sp.]
MRGQFTVGQLARETGIAVGTVRYYERIGLLPPADRSVGNQRLFDGGARRRLGFVRHARDLGFPLDAIRELLDLADHPERSCEGADAIARRHLTDVERRIVRLEGLRRELRRMIEDCNEGTVAHCHVIETLADHAHCLDDHAGSEPAVPSQPGQPTAW